MENDFLTNSLMLYIENDIAFTFSLDSIINDFEDLKERQISGNSINFFQDGHKEI